MESVEGEKEDHFECLSDELLSLIFNKVLDAKSLCRCSLVSKRFAAILLQTNMVLLQISPPKHSEPNPGLFWEFLKILLANFIAKPFQFLLRNSSLNSESSEEDLASRFVTHVLKNFGYVKCLHLELPSHGGEMRSRGAEAGPLLKWKAEFGSELESCVLLGAATFGRGNKSSSSSIHQWRQHHQQPELDLGLTSDGLKLRVAWMISCLFAASARHCLMKKIVADSGNTVGRVVIADASKQGRLYMGEDQLQELRACVKSSMASPMERTRVPAVRVKLWYAPVLELPASGGVMKGATLIVIRSDKNNELTKMKNDGELLDGAFDGEGEDDAFDEAVREMVKDRKPYLIEMNSF